MSEPDFVGQLDEAIGKVLDILDDAGRAGVELDPLESIMRVIRARGDELDLSDAPPLLQMLLGGIIDT